MSHKTQSPPSPSSPSWIKSLKDRALLAQTWAFQKPLVRVYFPLFGLTMIASNVILFSLQSNEEHRELMTAHSSLVRDKNFDTHQIIQQLKQTREQTNGPEYFVYIDAFGSKKRSATLDPDQFLSELFPTLVEQKRKLMQGKKPF